MEGDGRKKRQIFLDFGTKSYLVRVFLLEAADCL